MNELRDMAKFNKEIERTSWLVGSNSSFIHHDPRLLLIFSLFILGPTLIIIYQRMILFSKDEPKLGRLALLICLTHK